MKIGVRIHGGASLKVSFCEALPQMRNGLREITHVWCDPASRGQGQASELLQKICDEADTKRMVLMIVPDPYGGQPPLDVEKLTAWYVNKFFFQPIQLSPLILARVPFPKQVAPVSESLIFLPVGVQ